MNALFSESTNPVPVVFFVARGTNSSNIKNGQTLVFPVILNNKGSGFNNETGVFTAPVSGLYQFSVHLCIWVGQYVRIDIVSENDVIMKTRFTDEGSTYHSISSVSGLALLKRGNKVWVKSTSSSHGNNLANTPSIWNTFTGVLINESD
jgi:hypothetical protein